MNFSTESLFNVFFSVFMCGSVFKPKKNLSLFYIPQRLPVFSVGKIVGKNIPLENKSCTRSINVHGDFALAKFHIPNKQLVHVAFGSPFICYIIFTRKI